MKNKKVIIIMLTVAVGTFMSSLDSSAVSLIMPMVKNDFDVSLSTVEWIVIAYLLIISSLLLTFGRIADIYGHKGVYMTGFAVFTVGSLCCGLSVNIKMLVFSRVIQALGAAMLVSTGPAIITNAVPASNRGKALSVSAIAVALGLCTGPAIGGVLATVLGWQSIFFINVPIGILGLIMVILKIPKDEKKISVPFDFMGSFLVFSAILLILLPINISGDNNIPKSLFFLLIFAGGMLIFIFVLYEKGCRYPMLDIHLFENRIFTAGNIAALLVYMAEFIMVFIAPFYLENLRMFSGYKAGLIYLPMPVATMLIAPVSGTISDRFNSRFISCVGTFIMAAGLWMMSFFTEITPIEYIVISMIVIGLGFGLFQTPNNSAIMGSVMKENRGIAAGTLATMRNLGMVAGTAISGALFTFNQNNALKYLSMKGITGSPLIDQAFIYGLHYTFIAAVVVAVLAMAVSLIKGKALTQDREVDAV